MAIVGITPTFMSPMAFRDSSQQLAQASKDNAAALQNAFKFGTQVYDMFKNRAIGDALAKGDTNKAAQLESQKLNNADPSSFWRWNKGQEMQQAQIDEAKAQREADKQKAQNALLNEKQSVLDTVTSENPEAKIQFINNLNTMKAKLATNGIDTSDIDERIKQETANLRTINDKTKAMLNRNKVNTDIKEQISAGAVDSAMGLIADAIGNGTIDQNDADRFLALIAAKNRELEGQARNERAAKRGEITSQQNFNDEQRQRQRRDRWK